MYRVAVDRSHAVVSMTARGFFTEQDLAAAAAQLHRAIQSLGDRAGRHVTIYDLTNLQVAAPSVLAGFGRYFTDPAYQAIWARRVAIVTKSAMLNLQMLRVCAGRDDMQVFDDRGRAMAWLVAAADRGSNAA